MPFGAARPNAAPTSARGLQPTQGRPARPLCFLDHVMVVRLYTCPARAAFFSCQETRARKFEARMLGRQPLQPQNKWLQAQQMLFKMQKPRAPIRKKVEKARATRTRATATTQSSTPRPVVTPEEEAAPAPRACETDAPVQHQPYGTTTEAVLAVAAAGTRARATTTLRAPRQANTDAVKGAQASHAHETDHARRDRNATALRAPPQLQILPRPQQQGHEEQRPPSPLTEVFVQRGWHRNTSAAVEYGGEGYLHLPHRSSPNKTKSPGWGITPLLHDCAFTPQPPRGTQNPGA